MANNDISLEGYPDQLTVDNEFDAALYRHPNVQGWAAFVSYPNDTKHFGYDIGGNFFWFKDRKDFLTLLKSYPMFYSSAVETIQQQAIFDSIEKPIRDIIYQLDHDRISEDRAVSAINGALAPLDICINWCGPVESLRSCRSSIIVSLRNQFKLESSDWMTEEPNLFEDFLSFLSSAAG